METLSSGAETEQDSKPAEVDLSAIAEKYPVNQRTATLDLSTFNANKLSMLDVLDMAEKAGVEPENLSSLLDLGKNSSRKARMLVGLAWVLARRAEPDLTYEEVATWRITVVGRVDPDLIRRQAARDKALTAAAQAAGVPIAARAEDVTVGQMAALANRETRRRSRGRRR
jgi:hypothetical protein